MVYTKIFQPRKGYIGLMLGHRRIYWTNTKPVWDQRLVLTGNTWLSDPRIVTSCHLSRERRI